MKSRQTEDMPNKQKIVCVIPARGGSKGIPGKNLVDVNGLPLIAWSILAARASKAVDRVLVSTDSDEIARVATKWGAEVPYLRPPGLASDDIHSVHVVLHAIDWLDDERGELPTGIMMLLPTSPLRLASDISGVADLFFREKASSVVSVVNLGKYMTNLRFLEGNRLLRVAPSENPNAQRQGLEKIYSVNGSIFLAKPKTLRESATFHVEGALGYVMDPINSIDINSMEDLTLARRLCHSLEPWKSSIGAVK